MLKIIASTFCAAAVLAVGVSAWAAGSGHEARFGGIHLESKVMDMEVIAKPEVLQIYVSDHGKPLKIEGGKAKITLLNGVEKSELELAPAGDKFEAKGTFKVVKGTKGIVLVTLAGKASTVARFEVKQ